MISRRILKNIELSIVDRVPGWGQSGFRPSAWLTTAFFLALAVGLGLVLAFLIAIGMWPFAMALVVVPPAFIIFRSYPFVAYLFWMLVVPFLQTTTTSQTRQLYWVVYRALPLAVVCYTLFANRLRSDHRLHFRFGPDSVAMIGYLGWVVVNIAWHHPQGHLPYLYTLYDQSVIPFCVYWWVRCTAPGEQDLKRLVLVAFFLVIFEVIVGFLSWLQPQLLPREWVGYASGRTIGTLGTYTAYSLTLLFFSLLLLQSAMAQKSRWLRLALLAAFGLGIAGVFLSFSRGAWLGGVIALAGLLYLYPKPMLRFMSVLLILAVILGSTVLFNQIAYAEERLNSEDTAMVRLIIWDAGLQMIQLKPLWGWGYGDYRLYAGQFQERIANLVATKEHASHNTFISFAAELGVPGLLLYLFPVAWWLAVTFKRRQQLPKAGFWSQKLLIVFWLMVVSYSTVSFFSDIRTSTYGVSLWWLTLGWIAVLLDPFHTRDMRSPDFRSFGRPAGSHNFGSLREAFYTQEKPEVETH